MAEISHDDSGVAAWRVPKGAHETFLLLGGLLFVFFVGFVWAYGVYGKTITEGLDALCAEAAFQSGRKLEDRGLSALAVVRYRQAMEGRFANEETRLMCGRAIGDALMRQQRYAEAIAAYEALPPQAYRASGAYTGWVTSLWREGRLDDAKQQAKRWMELAQAEGNAEQESWAQHVLMRVAEDEGRPEDALVHGLEMLRLAPDSDAHMHLVRILRGMGRYAEAKGHLEAYLAHGSNPILREEAERVLPEVARLAAEQAGMLHTTPAKRSDESDGFDKSDEEAFPRGAPDGGTNP